MYRPRIKVSAVLRDFKAEIDRLKRFDAANQRQFSSPSQRGLTKRQLHLLTEALFFVSFRAYENFMRDIFLLYCLGKSTRSGALVKPFVRPRTFQHAEDLLKSAQRFLDWSSPDTVIERAVTYLGDGYPIKLPITAHLESLRDYRRIRNHIAHNSRESFEEYKKVVQRHFTFLPLHVPDPGEFLLEGEKVNPATYKLQTFFATLDAVSSDLT